ncbi:LysR family transcriptional regulator [Paraburkholderia ginsengiterrae]|uniref:LysR family transcriptional regulator n=1 Tax=Paraburkholderia ginsengiterrae TaxID=1462993 RepID=A0A1A9N518_9BURK|nr:LysR family transcriptional regulator [Paraburkholderia ginsengiterrae]OAJ57909.1 LysR family transcriptional regulator [Paraburkholderia ginsengiterrae]OAJ63093.1 LysR family transcriptional regulator [Paraburkholderia ginsengiterrae]
MSLDTFERSLSERTLQYLVAISQYGGMRPAAIGLDVNVSTISRQVALVERELRLSLVTRRGRKMELTEAGQMAVDYYRDCERNARRFRAQLDEYRGLKRGQVTIAMGEGIVTSLVPVVLKPFLDKYPGIVVEMRTGSLPQLLSMIREDVVDICVSIGASTDPTLNARLFQSEPLCAIFPVKHPMASRKSVKMEDLANERLVFMPAEFGLQAHVNAILTDIGRTYVPAFRCDRFSTATAIAAQNLAVAFMTRGAAQERIASGQVTAVPIDHPIARTFDRYVITRAGRRLGPAANYLLREIVRLMSTV